MSIRARPSAEPSHTRMHSYEVASSAAVSDARVRESKVDRLLSTVVSRKQDRQGQGQNLPSKYFAARSATLSSAVPCLSVDPICDCVLSSLLLLVRMSLT